MDVTQCRCRTQIETELHTRIGGVDALTARAGGAGELLEQLSRRHRESAGCARAPGHVQVIHAISLPQLRSLVVRGSLQCAPSSGGAKCATGDLYLEQADTLAIIVPATTNDRGWPNRVKLSGEKLVFAQPTFAVTEQPKAVARQRLFDVVGTVDAPTMREVDRWLRDFLALP